MKDGQTFFDHRGQQYIMSHGSQAHCLGYPGETRMGYMCQTDFFHEVGNTTTGPIFDSVEALKEQKKCADECGWVRVLLVAAEFGK